MTALKKWHRIARRTSHLEPYQLKPWFAALQHRPENRAGSSTFKDFCLFILLTGVREQEAARLTWDDVNLANRTVTFRQTKNHRVHTLPVGKWLTGLLERRKVAASSPDVFPSNSKVGHLQYHHSKVLAIIKQSGVEFRLHDLRRTFASIVNHHLGRSFSNYTIKRLLNHSLSDVTAGYIQIGVEDQSFQGAPDL